MYRKTMVSCLALTVFSLMAPATKADVSDDVSHLQSRWAEINYQLQGKTQVAAFENLVNEAVAATKVSANSAELLIWSGIIRSTYAGAKGGLGALGIAKAAKKDFESAMKLDASALEGSAYTSLGILYHSVPGWPIGFGDDEKAEELLKTGVKNNPNGIDSNYFYALFLADTKQYAEAEKYLIRAQSAPARSGRSIADQGRLEEISVALEQVRAEL